MPILYLDHSIVSHEPSWQSVSDTLALPGFRLALSIWNLVEIGSATDDQQRERRLSFLERLNPLWVRERIQVQKCEVNKFVSNELFGTDSAEIQVLTPHLSRVEADLAGPQVHIGLTPRQWIRGIDYKRIEALKELAPNALKLLQELDDKASKAKQEAIFKAWIKSLLPDAGPDGKLLKRSDKKEILEYCEAHRKKFFSVCKSLHVEDALSAARAANFARRPQRSDGIDLMHAVIALAYCDYFVVRDGFVAQCAACATKALAPVTLARVRKDAAALLKELRQAAL